jgi:hypothetical protein
MKYYALFLLSLTLNFFTVKGQSLIKKWETDSIFKVPESVLVDSKSHTLFVSNIEGKDPWGPDGFGSIAKMNDDGTSINLSWVKGLNAPKGMAMFNGKLYVADLNQVIVIHIKSATISEKITIPEAIGLNDITIDTKGTVYVSDTKGKKIFSLQNSIATIFLDSLSRPNGLLMHKGSFYFLNDGGFYKMKADKSVELIVNGMEGGTDGIVNVGANNFIISTWAGQVFYVNALLRTKKVLIDIRENKINTADIGFDAKSKTLYIPTFWRNNVIAYQLKQ